LRSPPHSTYFVRYCRFSCSARQQWISNVRKKAIESEITSFISFSPLKKKVFRGKSVNSKTPLNNNTHTRTHAHTVVRHYRQQHVHSRAHQRMFLTFRTKILGCLVSDNVLPFALRDDQLYSRRDELRLMPTQCVSY
jgi:hypothetical protein